jgi:hypothetical protein
MEQRKEFLEAALRREHSFTELCRRYGISRKNGYKWLNRQLMSSRCQAARRRLGIDLAVRTIHRRRSPPTSRRPLST